MNRSGRVVTVEAAGPLAELQAAQIWAAAVARRDALPDVPSPQSKLAGIHAAVGRDGGRLHLATAAGGPVGFAIVVPRRQSAELLYLAVEPKAWGRGVAQTLLSTVHDQAAAAEVGLELWVIADNTRAIAAYERAGWTPSNEVKVRNDSGRAERRMTRHHPWEVP